MLTRVFKVLLATTFIASTSFAQVATKEGIKIAIDISILDDLKTTYFNYILDIIRDIAIPYTVFPPDGYIDVNTFNIFDNATDVEFYTDVEKDIMYLQAKKISAQFHTGYFHFKWSIFLAKGHATAYTQNATITEAFSFSTQV